MTTSADRRPPRDAADATPELVVAGWALIELVEAAAKGGELGAGDEAESLYREAVDRLSRTRLRVRRARCGS